MFFLFPPGGWWRASPGVSAGFSLLRVYVSIRVFLFSGWRVASWLGVACS
jgi:hypothetical protein